MVWCGAVRTVQTCIVAKRMSHTVDDELFHEHCPLRFRYVHLNSLTYTFVMLRILSIAFRFSQRNIHFVVVVVVVVIERALTPRDRKTNFASEQRASIMTPLKKKSGESQTER